MPTRTDDVPEEATEEPVILTPEQDADRAARRLALQEGDPSHIDWPTAGNPLRAPGELSPTPAHRPRR